MIIETSVFLEMDLKQLLLFQWNCPPVEEGPTRYEFTQYKVYYSYGKHQRCYDAWYAADKCVTSLSTDTQRFLQYFNNRRNTLLPLKTLLEVMDAVNYEEIKNCWCLWAYINKDGYYVCERHLPTIFDSCVAGLRFVTDDLVQQRW